MQNILQLLKKPWAQTILIAIGGVLFGLIILGWWLMPVEWTDASPAFLREDFKTEYLRMTMDSYSVNKDAALAKSRWESLGPDAAAIFQKGGVIPESYPAGDLTVFAQLVDQQVPASAQPTPNPALIITSPDSTAKTNSSANTSGRGGLSSAIPIVFSVFCLLTLILGFVAFYVFYKRASHRRTTAEGNSTYDAEAGANYFSGKSNPVATGSQAIGQFKATYMLGDDHFDSSFAIDNSMGEYLGECGVGIYETIGVGNSKKVSSFEIWLFDKNDIQTITKVLMSKHTFGDPASRQTALTRGEPILAEPGRTILLETATLAMEARVIDMNYGQSALPVNSFFDRLSVELTIRPRK